MSYGVAAYAVDLAQLRAQCPAFEDGETNEEHGYELQRICARIGHVLPNEHWSAMRGDWFQAVDDATGVPLTSLLFYAGPPVAMPAIDDFPAIGHLVHGAIGEVANALLDALDRGVEEHIEAAVEEVLDWLEAAEARGGLVTFYY